MANADVRQAIDDGVAAWEREHFEEALDTFEGILEEHPYFADVHNKAGLCLAMMARSQEALDHFDRALEINPAYAEAHLNRGIILNELGRHEEARVALARAGEIDTRDSKLFPSELGNQVAEAHARLGDLYLVADLPEKAAEHFKQALDVRPRFQDIRGKLAEALIRLGDLVRAREELETVLEARPHLSEVRIRLGVVLQRLGEEDAAILEWRRCAADDPEDMRPRAYLASVGVDASDRGGTGPRS